MPTSLATGSIDKATPHGAQGTTARNLTAEQDPGRRGCRQKSGLAAGEDGGDQAAARFKEGSTVDFH